jgi:plastocyanin
MMRWFGILAILVVAVLLFGCAQYGQAKAAGDGEATNVSNATSKTTVSNETAKTNESAKATEVTVELNGYKFVPDAVTVKVGTKVTWINKDNAPHTITADDGSFDSSSFGKGQSWSRTFDVTGTFTYHCSIHSSMKGTIKVE